MNSTWLRISLVVAFASAMAFSQSTYSNINRRAGWQPCGSRAGPGGTAPNSPRALTLCIASPSLESPGDSARFSIVPNRAFSNALWWKQLGGTSATNFTYDFYIYIKNPGASQALEFDVNQASNGVQHIFGVPGAKVDEIYDVLAGGGPQLIVCRHEQNAAFIAAGIGRLTGTPGVILVTSGPGTTSRPG